MCAVTVWNPSYFQHIARIKIIDINMKLKTK